MSERIVLRTKERSVDEVVRGKSGKSVLSSLGKRQKNKLLDGGYHIFVAQHDEVLYECFAHVGIEGRIALKQQRRHLRREICRFFGVTLGYLETEKVRLYS